VANQQAEPQHAEHGDRRADELAVASTPVLKDPDELTDEQLDKVSGGVGSHEMKKSLIGNFPR
jgi:hypothetical protein